MPHPSTWGISARAFTPPHPASSRLCRTPATQRPACPRVLAIAGTDPTGGAGTAADIKSISANGGYAMAVTTAVVAQNTRGVRAVSVLPPDMVAAQLHAVGDDVALEAVKTGMLATSEIITTVAQWLRGRTLPCVVDPVMVATSGDRLLSVDAEEAMREFCRHASLITPNGPELALLVGKPEATSLDALLSQARRWVNDTGVAIVVKTGHLDAAQCDNYYLDATGRCDRVGLARIATTSTHGTGCSLSSAMATRLGAGDDPGVALSRVSAWLHGAIAHGEALRVGSGHGPIDHFFTMREATSVPQGASGREQRGRDGRGRGDAPGSAGQCASSDAPGGSARPLTRGGTTAGVARDGDA